MAHRFLRDGSGPMQFPGPVPPPVGPPWGPNGYPGDTVELGFYSGFLNLTPGTYYQTINSLLWTVDYTYAGTETQWDVPAHWSELSFTVNVLRTMHFGTVDGDLNQDGLLEVNWDNDYLSYSEGATTSFFVPGDQIDVTPLGVARQGAVFPSENPWVQPEQDMIARFDVTQSSVPEPTSLALLSLSGTLACAVGWWRRR